MNNKYLKYFLIVAVIGVWATVIFRVVHGMSGPDIPKVSPSIAAKNDLKIVADSFNLYADYPDPFLSEADTVVPDTSAKKNNLQPVSVTTNTSVLTEQVVAGIIQFNGIIDNPAKRSRIAFVTIRGKEYLVSEGEKLEDIRIRKIGKTNIRILYKGEPFTIDKP